MTELEKQAEEYVGKEFGIYQLKKLPNLNETVQEVVVKAYIKGFQDANKWVDCKEGLPMINEICLIFDKLQEKTYIATFVSLKRNNEEDWFVNENNIIFPKKHITHWMPLPEKPLK